MLSYHTPVSEVKMTLELPTYVTESTIDALKKEGIEEYSIAAEGKTDVGDGYMTDIFFVRVTGKKHGKTIELHLAVKVEKLFNAILGDPKIMRRFCERESRVYRHVFPALAGFLGTSIDYVPRCHYTSTKTDRNIIVLDNLRTQNYVLHDRFVPMNSHHLKLVLESYSHFHALSLVLRHRDPDRFEHVARNYDSMYLWVYETEFGRVFDLAARKSLGILKGLDAAVGAKFERTIEKGAKQVLVELLGGELEECVFTHGDAWNNNFLFRYEGDDKDIPSQVMILDWQLSSLQSPVIDILYFLFLSCSKVDQFDELLKFYHENLSRNISTLGSDPEELFPFDSLMRHWRKYSTFGLLCACGMLAPIMSDPRDNPDIDQIKDSDALVDGFVNPKSKYEDHVNQRLLALAKYYYEING